MPHITQSYDPIKGPYLDILVSKAAVTTFRPEEVTESTQKLTMLIDTGASKTAINPSVANRIGLMPMGKTELKTASHIIPANIFYVDLKCNLFTPPLKIDNRPVLSFPLAIEGLDGILGRDFLEIMIFNMNGVEKKYTLTY